MSDEFDIAIVGMAGRFPGAPDIDTFWRNLVGGVDSITRFSDEELLRSGVPASLLALPNYVKAAPILDEPGHFDAAFFGFAPMEARIMDPQHRILLELAHQALENAGYDPDQYPGRIGVFTGSAMNTYFASVGLNDRLADDYIPTLIGSDKDFLSTRISYKLNLKGPSITVQTACSTSMVAVHLARQSLLSEETDMALAGGISVRVPHLSGYLVDAGGVVSPGGQVRAFDAGANGTVFGSGGGILVLKRLADALSDGDTIHAILKGSAVNNDGSEKAGYTAPSVNSQADAVVEALANAGVDADSISYVEAHGSGTPVGDPIEISALTKAFRASTARTGYCAIGSVKTNVGHLDAAAAVTGIIKTVLALKHRELPPSLHFKDPNPEIEFSRTPFYVNTELRAWTSDGPRRAGVMSTGMGGTNAHVVLEESPRPSARAPDRAAQLLVLSAKTEAALDQSTHRLREFLTRTDIEGLGDIAYTLQIGRKALPHRRYLVCADRADAIAELGQAGSKRIVSARADESPRPVVFLLPGIGDHYVGMGRGLYETFPVFTQEVDRCAQILDPHLGVDVRSIIYPPGRSWKAETRSKGIDLKKMLAGAAAAEDPDTRNLNRTLFAQPALFTIEYAMARLWQSLGIRPDAIVGHSMGEYVAACLAGVLSLEDALRLIAVRARLVEELPQGAMLAAALPEAELLPLLPADLSISLINGPALCVVAGPPASVTAFEETLNARNVICRRVQNAHAFHSRMLDPIVERFEAEVASIRLREPRIPYISNVTGTWIAPGEATAPAYWAMHASRTARFSDALHAMWALANPTLVEVGPGRTLGVLAVQHPDRPSTRGSAVFSIRHHYESQSDVEVMWGAVGRLWASGKPIDWNNGGVGSPRRRVPLPMYPFERQNYWMETPSGDASRFQPPSPVPVPARLDDWFYTPSWERRPFAREVACDALQADAFWLIFADRYGGGMSVKEALDDLRQPTSLVRFGKEFAETIDGSYTLDPTEIQDYLRLFRALDRRRTTAINIVHLGSVTRNDDETARSDAAASQAFGFYSLLQIAQAIGELNITVPVTIGIISNRIHEVTGEETLDPAMATVLGPCGVIPKELPNVKCFNIDLPDDRAIDSLPGDQVAAILGEYADPPPNQVVAYRGRHRWARSYDRIKLPKPTTEDTSERPTEIRRLRNGGVYLITGGTGGIGLAVARRLAESCRARIVLTKRTALPEKSRWRELSKAHETPATLRRTIDSLLEIEELGAEVLVLEAEASNRKQMRRAIETTYERFGVINGVIHAAGIVRAGLIQTKTNEGADGVLAPKVYGTMILFDLLKEADLDFAVLFSSITSVITPYAESDYSGANAFLDAFAHAANARRRFHTLAINWPGWKEVGQLADLEVRPGLEGWKEDALSKAILTRDGLEAFSRALNSDLTQVIVSPEDLTHLLEQSRSPFDHEKYLSPIANDGKAAALQGGGLDSGGRPSGDVETKLTEIWKSVLGFDQIRKDDNFSQIGGHSLLAMQIVTKVRSAFRIDLTLREFFEAPTISQLGDLIGARVDGRTEPRSESKELSALSPLGQRFFRATGRQTPFFLGPGNRQVFAIYHPPAEANNVLTVICPPLLNEYMRTQLALRELAIDLAEKGQHVLRMDYRGTGDSFGDLEDMTLTDWLDDIGLAVREGCDRTGSSEVRLLGVRASALVACTWAGSHADVGRVVLWDPVTDGAEYLRAMRRVQVEIIERDVDAGHSGRRRALHEYAGYGLSERMVEEFRMLDRNAYSHISTRKLRVVSTSSAYVLPVDGVFHDEAGFACNWETDLENLMMPKPVLERLSECLICPDPEGGRLFRAAPSVVDLQRRS